MQLIASKRGDTLIEVLFALAIFSLLSILSIKLMNTGVANSEANLESTQARSELDTQAEAIRFIYDSYISSLTDSNAANAAYANIWKTLATKATDDSNGPIVEDLGSVTSCGSIYDSSGEFYSEMQERAFFINVRALGGKISSSSNIVMTEASVFSEAGLYPRIRYSGTATNFVDNSDDTDAQAAEGFWVTLAYYDGKGEGGGASGYDVYLQACWNAPGKNTPTVLDTVIRLYDPTAASGGNGSSGESTPAVEESEEESGGTSYTPVTPTPTPTKKTYKVTFVRKVPSSYGSTCSSSRVFSFQTSTETKEYTEGETVDPKTVFPSTWIAYRNVFYYLFYYPQTVYLYDVPEPFIVNKNVTIYGCYR